MSRYTDHRRTRDKTISIRAGKFESDRLSVGVKHVWQALQEVSAEQEKTELLLECRALAKQLIEIIQR